MNDKQDHPKNKLLDATWRTMTAIGILYYSLVYGLVGGVIWLAIYLMKGLGNVGGTLPWGFLSDVLIKGSPGIIAGLIFLYVHTYLESYFAKKGIELPFLVIVMILFLGLTIALTLKLLTAFSLI